MPAGGPKSAPVKRRAFVILASSAALAGCKEPANSDSGSQFVTPGTDIVIHSVRLYSASENSVEGDTIYLVNFGFTNHLGYEFAPKIDHFVFVDLNQVRHSGLLGGSIVTAGISNYTGTIKPGDSHDYTVGYRVYVNTSGTLYYDPS